MHEIMSCQTRTGALPGAAACTMGRRSRHLVAEGGTTVAQIAARTFLNELDAQHVPYELMPHPRTETALAEAEALGVEPAHVAKTVILTTRTGFVRAVIPAPKRLDLDKVRNLLDTSGARKSTRLNSSHVKISYAVF